MSNENINDTKKTNKSWMILLIFPLLGVAGMVFVLLGSSDSPQTKTGQRPTPPPIETTPVPTVVINPILDNLAPINELTTFDGESFTLDDLTGQIVILNFWATWCPPCVREMPTLEKFAESHPNIVVLSVTNPTDGQTIDDIHAFIDQYNLTNLAFGLDADSRLQLNLNALNLPTTFVLDQEGYVRFRQIGEVTADDLTYYVNELSS